MQWVNGKNFQYFLKIDPLRFLAFSRYGKANQEGDTEHARLSRVLDVAQELKALSMLLQSNYFPFVIDLAVLASRREYLNLDKWLADQMQVNKKFVLQQ